MKTELNLTPDNILVLDTVLSDICSSQPITTLEKVNKCILIDVFKIVNRKAGEQKIKQTALFDKKKKVKLSFKISEAYYLLQFLNNIDLFNDTETKFHIQKIINLLDQKLC